MDDSLFLLPALTLLGVSVGPGALEWCSNLDFTLWTVVFGVVAAGIVWCLQVVGLTAFLVLKRPA